MSEPRRTEVLNHLEALILANGFSRFTMDDLAAEVRCSKSTLYALSSSKESLVATLFTRFFREAAELVERVVAPIQSERERIAVYLSAVGHEMKRMSATCYEDMILLPVTRDIYEHNSHAVATRVYEFIERGVEANEFRAANARFIGRAVALLIDGIQHGVLLERTGLSSGDAYAELGSLVLNALTNRSSGELPGKPFVPSPAVGSVPELPRRVAFANLGEAEIFTVWGRNMRSAAEARGLEYVEATANFDPATNVRQVDGFLTEGVGALLVVLLDVGSQRPLVRRAMDDGVAVFTVPFGPGTTQILTDQYAAGKAAAERMVEHIDRSLGGTARILMLNLDDREELRPRYQAVRDVVAAASTGITIVVDQLGSQQTREFGYETMNAVLASGSDPNVVIGEDAHVLGALTALRRAGVHEDPRWLLVGIGGEEHALEEVASGTSPLKVDVAFALPAIGVIPAKFGDDWLAGRGIPSVVSFKPIVLDSAMRVGEFLADMENPELLFTRSKQDAYLSMLGSTSYQDQSCSERSDGG